MLAWAIQPTWRADRGRPAKAATSPYVSTFPRGMAATTARTRSRKLSLEDTARA